MIDKTAIICGVTGQDGSYLADILLEKGYKVVGFSRRRSGGGDWRIQHLINQPNFILEFGDITDSGSLVHLVDKYGPDEFYNLAAQSFVGLSWKEPYHTGMVTALGVTNCLEAIRHVKPDTRFYQASSSEMFGKVREMPQNEDTPFYPRSPYGAAKVYGYWITRNYRESYGIYASNGILFNHESPRRSIEFVTRKITDGIAKIMAGYAKELRLGNLDARRDWGHAEDYMRAAHLMLQQDVSDDYVVATNKAYSIREFLDKTCEFINVTFGKSIDWRNFVIQDERFFRPAEVDILLGDPSKAKEKLGWEPDYTFGGLVIDMISEDLQRYGLF